MGKPRPALPYTEANKQGAADVPGAHQGGLIGWRKKSPPPPLGICGGGLAGCLAAVYLARRGEKVDLYEFRPVRRRRTQVAPTACVLLTWLLTAGPADGKGSGGALH